MDLMANLWHGLLTSGLPLIAAANNPRIYPFALGAIALTLALTIVRLVQTRRASTLLGAVFGLPVIELAWLGFSTPVDHLFGFAPSGATAIAAEIVHGVLALLPLVLVVIWQLQLGRSPLSLWGMAIELGVCGLLVAGIELQGWPGDLVATLEAVISAVVFLGLAIAIAKLSRNAAWPHWLLVLYFGLWCAALVLALFAHPIQSPLVALCLLFLAIVCLDGMAGTRLWRFLVTVPLALAIGVLGAANVFAPYSLAPGLSSGVWLEAAGAGAVFLFVVALFDWTKQRISKHLTDEQRHALADHRARSDLERARNQRDFMQRLRDQLSGQESASAALLDAMKAQEQADEQRLDRLARLGRRLVTDLDGKTAAFCFVIVVAYYLLVYFAADLPDPVPVLRPIAGATLITVVGLAINQFITYSVDSARKLRSTLGGGGFMSVRRVIGIFLFLVLGLYGLGGQLGSVTTQGDCADPGNTSCVLIDKLNGLTHTVGVAPAALLGNGTFWIAAGRITLGAALVLLALGQWRFVHIVNRAEKAVQKAEEGNKGASASATQPSAAQPAGAAPVPAAVSATTPAGASRTN